MISESFLRNKAWLGLERFRVGDAGPEWSVGRRSRRQGPGGLRERRLGRSEDGNGIQQRYGAASADSHEHLV